LAVQLNQPDEVRAAAPSAVGFWQTHSRHTDKMFHLYVQFPQIRQSG
jgi:hypothetical protein